MATLNIGLKVNRAITGATTVNANAVAVVTYTLSAYSQPSTGGNGYLSAPQAALIRTFGPSQAIPSSVTVSSPLFVNGASYTTNTYTYSLSSGFELVNTQ